MRKITVVAYDARWPEQYETERALLQATLGQVIYHIHHIGSTSVPGLAAKPVIDILLEVTDLDELDRLLWRLSGTAPAVKMEYRIAAISPKAATNAAIRFMLLSLAIRKYENTWRSVII